MADWDDDEWDVPDLNQTAGGPPETWSDEEGHDAHKEEARQQVIAVPKAAPAPPKPLTGLAAKIAEREAREAEEARQKEELRKKLGGGDDDDFEGLEGEALEKAKQKKMQEAADLDNAIDAFGLVDTPKPIAKPAAQTGAIESFEPTSDKDFETLAGLINDKMKLYEGKTGHMVMLKELLRKATASISTEEAKDLSSFVAVLYNDKVKADRDKDKGKKKSKGKAKASMSAGKAVDNDYDDYGGGGGGHLRDDDYDFM